MLPSLATRSRVLTGLLLALLICFLISFLRVRPAPQPQPTTPDFDYIRAKAWELGMNRGRILEFVRRGIVSQAYHGSLRGAVGALWNGGGNDLDRAHLLAELLRARGDRVRLAGDAQTAWIQLAEDDRWRDVYLHVGQPILSPSWTAEEPPAQLRHQLEVAVEVRTGDVRDQQSLKVDTARLAGAPLLLRFEGRQYLLRLSGSNREDEGLQGWCRLHSDETLTLVFTHRRPDGRATTYRREISTKRFDDSRPQDDPRNVHVIAALPAELPRAIFETETHLARQRWSAEDPASAGYLLALSHMVESDRELERLRTHFQTDAYFDEPRVIIASTYYRKNQRAPLARALDLRRNVVRIDGNQQQRARLAVTRSVFEGALEAEVLKRATGAPVISSLAVFRQHLQPFVSSTPGRLATYKNLLDRFRRETPVGAHLILRSGKHRSVELKRVGDTVRCTEISPLLKEKMQTRKDLPFAQLKAESIAPAQYPDAALELETLLGPLAGSEVDYRIQADVRDSLEELLRPGVRIFKWSWRKKQPSEKGRTQNEKTKSKKPRYERFVGFDFELLKLDPQGALQYHAVDHYDEVNDRKYRVARKYTVPAATMNDATQFSTWYSQSGFNRGRQNLFLSRKMFRELKEQGYTNIQYVKYNGRLTPPIKAYLCSRRKIRVVVNNQPRELPVLFVAGGYASDKLPRQDYSKVKELRDDSAPPKASGRINRWIVLDDPRYPMLVSTGTRFQTALPGRVVSAATGRGVQDAQIRVEGVQCTSWADGRFRLPVLRKLFSKFKVRVDCPGYEPLERTIDFAKPGAFPLVLELKPAARPEAMLWITAENLGQALPQIQRPHVRALVRQAIEDNRQLAALVPRKSVAFGAGQSHAWLLLDRKTFHITPVGQDGLHGVAGVAALQLAVDQADPRKPAVSAYAGTVASWYAYSAGKLDALGEMMQGKQFDDLGHAHARQFALEFLQQMKRDRGFLAAAANVAVGVNLDAFEAGFLAGLMFFENNPAYRGK